MAYHETIRQFCTTYRTCHAENGHGLRILRRHEAHGVEDGSLVPGARGSLRRLKGAGIECVLVSSNSRETDRVLEQPIHWVDMLYLRRIRSALSSTLALSRMILSSRSLMMT